MFLSIIALLTTIFLICVQKMGKEVSISKVIDNVNQIQRTEEEIKLFVQTEEE